MKRLLFFAVLLLPSIGLGRMRYSPPENPDQVLQNDRDLLDYMESEFDLIYSSFVTVAGSIVTSTVAAESPPGYCIDSPTLCVDTTNNEVDITGILNVSTNVISSGAFQGGPAASGGTALSPVLSFQWKPTSGFYTDSAGNINITQLGSQWGSMASGDFSPTTDGGKNLGKASFGWGRVFSGNGTASAPGFTFSANGGNGMGHASNATYFTSSVGEFNFYSNGSQFLNISDGSNVVLPLGAAGGTGSVSLGNASWYWNDVSYKTLSDRGCLASFDDGVLMPNGKTVSDLESFSLIKTHPTKLTIYGKPMLDYKSFPVVSYKKASYEKDGETKYFLRDADDEPYFWQWTDEDGNIQVSYGKKKPNAKAEKKLAADGVEMTSMQSIMIGALKEANERIKALEARVAALESSAE